MAFNDFVVANAQSATSPFSGAITVPTSVLTRPANTTAYAGSFTAAQSIASSVTAGSVVVPSFPIANPGGHVAIPLMSISTNVTTGWGGVALLVTLWNSAPTYSTGDGGTYTVATGAGKLPQQYSVTLTQFGDGASGVLVPLNGTVPVIAPLTASVYWDIAIQASATPISGQTFTLVPQVWN